MTCHEGSLGGHFFRATEHRWVCVNCLEVRDRKTGTSVVVPDVQLEVPADLGMLDA